MAKKFLPNSIAKAPHIDALEKLAADRLEDIDIGLVSLYLIDNAPVVALPYLAAQFNLLGYKGWRFADTEQKQRDLIKQAIELHRYKGTPYGLKQALTLCGVIGAIEIQERTVIRYNGEINYDGLGYYGNHWAYFRVLIDAANVGGLSMTDIKGVIAEYKGARNWLLSVGYKQYLRDTVQLSENLTTTPVP
jgi:phage tail P2-like protein